MHLIEDLFLDGRRRHAAAGIVCLADPDRALAGDGGDGKTDMGKVGHVLEAGVREIGAGDLGAAFQQMPGQRSRRERIPVLFRPAKLMDQRAKHQGRVGGSSDHHDICAASQRLGNRAGADIGVGGDNAVTDGQSFDGLVCADLFLVHHRQQIVAGNDCDTRSAAADFPGNFQNAPGTARRVCGAEIGDDANVVIETALQNRPHIGFEKR